MHASGESGVTKWLLFNGKGQVNEQNPNLLYESSFLIINEVLSLYKVNVLFKMFNQISAYIQTDNHDCSVHFYPQFLKNIFGQCPEFSV